MEIMIEAARLEVTLQPPVPKWRNWQTRQVQDLVPVTGVEVRVLSSALFSAQGWLHTRATLFTCHAFRPGASRVPGRGHSGTPHAAAAGTRAPAGPPTGRVGLPPERSTRSGKDAARFPWGANV